MTSRIILGDCRTILPTIAHTDVVITDPVWPNCPPGLLPGSEDPMGLFGEAMELMPASVRTIVVVLRNDSDPRFLAAMPARWRFLCAQWLQYAVVGYYGRLLGGNEVAYSFGDPPPSREGHHLVPGVAPKAQSTRKSAHPSPRSLTHMKWLVDKWTAPGDIVLDPFAGSGTTLLAAEHWGRDSIGIEINPEYADLARARLRSDAPLLGDPVATE